MNEYLAGISKPVLNLALGKPTFSAEGILFLVSRVGVLDVVVQPIFENAHRSFWEVGHSDISPILNSRYFQCPFEPVFFFPRTARTLKFTLRVPRIHLFRKAATPLGLKPSGLVLCTVFFK